MYTQTELGVTIEFKYDLDQLFNQVSNETLAFASKVEKDGNLMTDEFGISDDERDQFNMFINEGYIKVFQRLLKMTGGVVDSMAIDLEGDAVAVPAVAPTCTVKVRDKKGYNRNYLPIIDGEMFLALKNFVMKEWYVKCNLGDQGKYYTEKYMENLRSIQRYGLALRKSATI